jgi:hypothetical protein
MGYSSNEFIRNFVTEQVTEQFHKSTLTAAAFLESLKKQEIQPQLVTLVEWMLNDEELQKSGLSDADIQKAYRTH